MPKALEQKLMKEAKKKGLSKKRTGAYVYGTMNKMGLMKGSKKLQPTPDHDPSSCPECKKHKRGK